MLAIYILDTAATYHREPQFVERVADEPWKNHCIKATDYCVESSKSHKIHFLQNFSWNFIFPEASERESIHSKNNIKAKHRFVESICQALIMRPI